MSRSKLPSTLKTGLLRLVPGSGMSIRSVLNGLIGLTVLIVAGQAWFGLRQLTEMHEGLARITKNGLPAVEAADRINIRINDIRSKQYRLFVTSEAERGKALENLDRGTRAVADARRAYEALITDHEERAAYGRFSQTWTIYSDLWAKAHDLLRMGRQEEALALFKTDMWRVSDEAGVAIDDLVDLVRRNAIEAARSAEAAYRTANVATYVALGFALAMAVLAAAFIFLRIARPLGSITTALTRLAAGDRGFTIPETNRGDEIGQMAKAFDVFRGRTLELEQAHRAIEITQREAQALARHDALTGLPNRRLFASELQEAVRRTEIGLERCSMLLIDLDGFKPVNDRFGHATGDAVLCEIANRLSGVVRGIGLAARLGGDEFAVLTGQGGQTAAGHEALIRLASQVIQAVQEPISIGATCVRISASVGIASCPAGGESTEALMRAADMAMYRAKQDGPGRFMFFERRFDEEIRTRTMLEGELRQAILEGDIRPFYQPVMCLADKSIVGFEILARWDHPRFGFIPPDQFIPMAEQLDAIADLTTRILRQACLDAKHWPSTIFISLNVSAVEVHDASLPTRVMSILAAADFPPSRLEVEITETALIRDEVDATSVLVALQTLGIRLTLDDFGTGYSSLNHLVNLSLDKVKIDCRFTRSMDLDSKSAKIVDAVLTLARSIGVGVVAEGIESEAVMERLVAGGCQYGQGYHLGEAVAAEEALRLVQPPAMEQVPFRISA